MGALVNLAENLRFPNKKENTQILAFPEGSPIPTLDQNRFCSEPPPGGLGTYLSCTYLDAREGCPSLSDEGVGQEGGYNRKGGCVWDGIV